MSGARAVRRRMADSLPGLSAFGCWCRRASSPAAGAALIALAALLYLVVVLRSAWLAEDAYITFRTVDNLLHGYGLTWNPPERVQAYTHPLWLLLLSPLYALTHEIYYTAVALAIACSLASALLLSLGLAGSRTSGALAIAVLASSKAYVDYSTSGLENPLTHLLLALFVFVHLRQLPARRRIFWLSLAASLLGLCRLDALLLVLPALGYESWRARRPAALAALAAGLSPLALWTAFSLFYYGFPFPNTAYAKLATGLERHELLLQGARYLANSLREDPVTLVATAGALAAVVVTRAWARMPLVLGIATWLVYVVAIGGDFMSGRFLTAPLFLAVALAAAHPTVSRRVALVAGALLVGSLWATPHPPLLSGDDYGDWPDKGDSWGIADERAFYYADAGLLRGPQDEVLRQSRRPQWGLGWAAAARWEADHGAAGTFVAVADAIGYAGYYAGPQVYILNPLALSDALLARLPAQREESWRIGHFRRAIPAGYVETLKTGVNAIADSSVARYYDRLRRVIRGPLGDWGRLGEIWALNTDRYDDLRR
ncbi:MAG: hypothetical protein ABIL09_09535 [Gemmatimonadota bacterium]